MEENGTAYVAASTDHASDAFRAKPLQKPGVQREEFIGAYIPVGYVPDIPNIGIHERLSEEDMAAYMLCARAAHEGN
jgi:hypothetical protein